MPWGWSVANALVFRKVRQALGLDRCKMCMTAAAPIMRDTLDFFASLNIPILEIYGMSETSGWFPWFSFNVTQRACIEFAVCTFMLIMLMLVRHQVIWLLILDSLSI